MRFESRTGLTLMRLQQAGNDEKIAYIRAELEAIRLYLKARREEKYSPGQPRWPEGHPHGGEWKPKEAGEGSEEASSSDEDFGIAPDGTRVERTGGIPNDKLNWTTQQFMSQYCEAGIRSVMPSQFLNMPILDVMGLAQQGDRAAIRCMKLLKENRFRK